MSRTGFDVPRDVPSCPDCGHFLLAHRHKGGTLTCCSCKRTVIAECCPHPLKVRVTPGEHP